MAFRPVPHEEFMKYLSVVCTMAAFLACSTTSSTVRPTAEPMTMKPAPAAPVNNPNDMFEEDFFSNNDVGKDRFLDDMLIKEYKAFGLTPPPAMMDPAFAEWVRQYRKGYRAYATRTTQILENMWAQREVLREKASPHFETRKLLSDELSRIEMDFAGHTLIGVDLVTRMIDVFVAEIEGRGSDHIEANFAALQEAETEIEVREKVMDDQLEPVLNYFADLRVDE